MGFLLFVPGMKHRTDHINHKWTFQQSKKVFTAKSVGNYPPTFATKTRSYEENSFVGIGAGKSRYR